MASPDMSREHRKSLAAVTSDPERALLHGRRAFATLPKDATPVQQAQVLQRMVTETVAIKAESPGRAFVAAHGALALADLMPDGTERVGIKKTALQTMGTIATTTYDAGSQMLGARMYEKARLLAEKAGFGYDTDVARGVRIARGEPEPETAPEPLHSQPARGTGNPRQGRNAELDALQRSQNGWRQGQSADLTAAVKPTAGDGQTVDGTMQGSGAPVAGSLSPGASTRTKLSAVGASPHTAPKSKIKWGKWVTRGVAAVVAGGLLLTYMDRGRENRDLQLKNQALTQVAMDQAARGRAAVQVDPYWAQQAGITPDGKALREQLETFRRQHPTEFNQIAEEMRRSGTVEGGLNRLVEINPQMGTTLRTQSLAFVASSSGPNGGNNAVAGRQALVNAFDEVNFNGQQADALRRGEVQRTAPAPAAGPAPR